jgi:hypothetical protein
MKASEGMDVLIHIFLTSALVGGEWSSTPLPLYTRGKAPRYPLDRRLAGPQSRSGQCGEEKILDPTRTQNPTRHPAHSQLLYYAIPAPQN